MFPWEGMGVVMVLSGVEAELVDGFKHKAAEPEELELDENDTSRIRGLRGERDCLTIWQPTYTTKYLPTYMGSTYLHVDSVECGSWNCPGTLVPRSPNLPLERVMPSYLLQVL